MHDQLFQGKENLITRYCKKPNKYLNFKFHVSQCYIIENIYIQDQAAIEDLIVDNICFNFLMLQTGLITILLGFQSLVLYFGSKSLYVYCFLNIMYSKRKRMCPPRLLPIR